MPLFLDAKIIFTLNSAEVSVVNKGRFRPDTVQIKIYIDKNRDGNLTDDEKFRDIEHYSGNSDTVSLVFSLSQFQTFAGKPGWFLSYLTVEDKARQNQSSHSAEFFCSYPRNSVVINEFLFDESDSSGEYVELINTTSDSVPLRDWFISNRHSVQGFDSIFIADENALILPNGYYVIFWDSLLTRKFPELKENIQAFQAVSNMNLKVSGDEFLLNDAAYAVQDSLAYSDTWQSKDLAGRKDVSVERISVFASSTDASNWASCGDIVGGTPLKLNSVSIQPKNEIELTAEPNPFSPADVGIKQTSKISYKLPFRSARIKCSIFTPDGILLVELINNDYASSEGSLIWDGKDSNGANAPAGPYIFLIEAVDAVSGNVSDGKMMIVVGK